MSPHDTALEQNEYRLVLVKSGSRRIWTERNCDGLRLPRIVIDRWARQAEKLQQGVEANWHIRTIVLDILSGRNGGVPCVVVEIISSPPYDGLAATSVDEISEVELTIEERDGVKATLTGSGGARGPFAQLGWIQEAKE